MAYIFAIILGLIEGITEYLPISSTGHLLVASALLNFPPENLRATFDIVIQIGPVIAVVVYFRHDLWERIRGLLSDRDSQRFWLNILIAFVPAGVVGLLLGKLLETPSIIAATMIIGGILFLLIDRGQHQGKTTDVNQVTPLQALGIGIAQIVALIPGVSRSGATIIGGLLLGLDRKTATRFTFYLAIPTLVIATLYSLYKAIKDGQLHTSDIAPLLIGTAVAFVAAYAAIAWFLRFVSTHTFRGFGIYRIVAGVIIIALIVAKILS